MQHAHPICSLRVESQRARLYIDCVAIPYFEIRNWVFDIGYSLEPPEEDLIPVNIEY